MLGYLSADIVCSEQRTVFRERSSRKTVSYEEQIMCKDKYPSIFSPQIEAIVFINLQIFFTTCAVLKIGEYPRIFPSFSWEIFAHVTRLDQSRASENIWWIIRAIIIHQILSLARDWSKRVTWVNITQLKLRNIRRYYFLMHLSGPESQILESDWLIARSSGPDFPIRSPRTIRY